MSIPTYVLHAAHLADRKERIAREMGRVGLPFEWVTVETTPEADEKFIRPGHALRASHISLAIKHIVAMQNFIATGAPIGLFIEDDVRFGRAFRAKLDRAIREIGECSSHAVAYLSCGHSSYVPLDQLIAGRLLHPAQRNRTSDLYLLTRDAALARLAWIKHNRINEAIDVFFDECDHGSGIEIYWADPPLAKQLSLSGGLETSISENQPSRAQMAFKFFRRSVRRAVKRFFYINATRHRRSSQ